MEVPSWLAVNVYTAALLLMLLAFSSGANQEHSRGNTYICFLATTLFLLLAETASHFAHAGNPFLGLGHAGNYAMFALDPAAGYFTLKYIDSWSDRSGRNESGFAPSSKIQKGFLAFVVVNFVLVSVAQALRAGWFYSYAADGYYRGPFFLARAGAILVQYLVLEAHVFANRTHYHPSYFFPIALLPCVTPLLGALQVALPNIQLEYVGTTFAALLLFVYVQNSSVNEDFLTGASNRRRLFTTLARAIEESDEQPFAIIMIDVDYFKQINDRYGHAEGDAALAEVVHLLKGTFRRGDVVSRYGGDEFCVLATVESPDNLGVMLKRLQENLARFNDSHAKPYTIGLSCGAALYDSVAHPTAEALLEHVDALLYKEKLRHHKDHDLAAHDRADA